MLKQRWISPPLPTFPSPPPFPFWALHRCQDPGEAALLKQCLAAWGWGGGVERGGGAPFNTPLLPPPLSPLFTFLALPLPGEFEEESKQPTMTEQQRHQLKHRELFLSRQFESLPATHIRWEGLQGDGDGGGIFRAPSPTIHP